MLQDKAVDTGEHVKIARSLDVLEAASPCSRTMQSGRRAEHCASIARRFVLLSMQNSSRSFAGLKST